MSLLQIRLEEIPPTQFGGKLCPTKNAFIFKIYIEITYSKGQKFPPNRFGGNFI
jgi:hypothetical protein